MSVRTVRVLMFGLVAFALIAANVLATRSGVSSYVRAAEANDTRIQALRKERLAALEGVAEVTRVAYRHARVSFTEVAEANRAVRNAELELCETDAERITVLEKMLTEAKELEKFAEGQKQAGLITEVTMLKAKIERLTVEIALEKAKAR